MQNILGSNPMQLITLKISEQAIMASNQEQELSKNMRYHVNILESICYWNIPNIFKPLSNEIFDM